jgi:DNA-binding NarL/FixJ family response regulator
MTTNVLIINRQLVFAVTIKQALEQTGAFEVHPFTSPDAALEYIRSHPHDVALVDFTLPDGPGIVRRLRALQPEIAVIISPNQPNSGTLIRELGLQGMIDAPFSARAIIPLIEHAVEQIEQPLTAITRSLDASDDPSSGETELLSGGQFDILVDETEYRRSPKGSPKTGDAVENLPGTRQLPEHLPTTNILKNDEIVENLPVTRNLPEQLPSTRVLNTDEPAEHFDEAPSAEIPDWLQQRLSEQPALWGIDEEEADKPAFNPTAENKQTRIFDEEESELDLSPSVPVFSTLDSILANVAPSEMFEPKTSDEDTPAVPSVDSGAVRQFLATKSPASDDVFGSVLGEIPAESVSGDLSTKSRGDTFEDLVKSMRGDKTHTPLPDRHQQFIDFILTGGMDNLLTEIEKHKTDSLPALPDEESESVPTPSAASQGVFERLAEEEPPMPTLEESGTVGDLMLGVSDTGFRNVLAMMQGEEIDEAAFEAQERARTERDIDEAFRNFFDQQVAVEMPETQIEIPPLPIEPREASPTIPAQLILETALDESSPIDSFSLSDLINNIERQLSEHTPEVQPPPSWGITAIPRPKQDDRYIKEPDFLPEEFPTEKPIQKLPSRQDEEVSLPISPPTADIDWSVLDEAEVFDDESMNRPDFQEASTLDSGLWENPVTMSEMDGKTFEEPAAEVEESPALDTGMWDDLYATDEAENLEAPVVQNEPSPVLDMGMWDDLYASDQPVEADAWDVERSAFEDEAPEANLDELEQLPALDMGMWDDLATVRGEAWEDAEADEASAEWDAPLSTGIPLDLSIDESVSDETVVMQRDDFGQVDLGQMADFAPSPSEMKVVGDDPYIAQIALSLTQVSLELTAEATLLTRDSEIVASAGQLSAEDIAEFGVVVNDDWSAGPDESRIRFITLPSSGKGYMLYSRRTAGDFTLSMIFADATPLRDIRRQGKRLTEALDAVPDVPPPVPIATVVDTSEVESVPSSPEPAPPLDIQLTPYSYVWLLRDGNTRFDEGISMAIRAGLAMQLREQGWQIRNLEAHDEYIYLVADVPGEQPAHEVVSDLKRRAAEIAHMQDSTFVPQSMWADSYLIMTPGRELHPDEIDQFIQFERMF